MWTNDSVELMNPFQNQESETEYNIIDNKTPNTTVNDLDLTANVRPVSSGASISYLHICSILN